MTPTKPMTAEIRTMNASIAAQCKAQMNHVHKCICAGCEQLDAIASGQHAVIEARELERLRTLDATHAAICQGLITAEFMEGEEDDVLAVLGTFIDHHKSKEAEIVRLRAENEALRKDAERLEGIRQMCGFLQDSSDVVVTLFQDDATRSFCVRVGARVYYGSSFKEAIDAAIAKEGK